MGVHNYTAVGLLYTRFSFSICQIVASSVCVCQLNYTLVAKRHSITLSQISGGTRSLTRVGTRGERVHDEPVYVGVFRGQRLQPIKIEGAWPNSPPLDPPVSRMNVIVKMAPLYIRMTAKWLGVTIDAVMLMPMARPDPIRLDPRLLYENSRLKLRTNVFAKFDLKSSNRLNLLAHLRSTSGRCIISSKNFSNSSQDSRTTNTKNSSDN